MEVRDHKLTDSTGTSVRFVESPNQASGVTPIYLIIHYTAGATTDGAVSWFQNKDAAASAHIVIGRDGEVVQMIPFNKRAWHAGVSKWGELEGLNRYSLGIELVNNGRLRKRSDGKWVNWTNKVIDSEFVTTAKHKHDNYESGWDEYPEEQLESVGVVARALHAAYQFSDVLGHDDISPGRKSDPGPLFPMDSFRSRVLGRK